MSERDRDSEPEATSAEAREDGKADGQQAALQEPGSDAQPADDVLSPEEVDALAAWAVPDPPAGFADRVVAAQERVQPVEADAAASPIFIAPPSARSWRRAAPWIVVAVAAVVALLLVQLRAPGGGANAAGSAAPLARESIRLGPRGVAVAEAGSQLTWTIEGGRARVSQRAGDVFYRVERGGGFEVETPHGTVRVTGTCFRVELETMKKPWQGVVGAAIGAALVVTVYEGSVLFASRDGSERAVAAGQVASSSERGVTVSDARSAPAAGTGAAAGSASPPSAGATRDELLLRDAQQRAEIATLRARMRQLEQLGPRLGRDDERDASGRPWFDPSKEDLVRFASECRLRTDMPSFLHGEPIEWGPRRAREAGLSDQELAAVNKVLQDMQREVLAQLRALYIEVTGDQERADDLSPQAMVSELQQKSPEGEEGRVNQRIAQERAGLATPPVDLSQASALERYVRRRAGLGDETQRRIGDVVGAARARQLRESEGGWGGQWETVGCPGDGAEQDDQQR